MKYLLVLAVLAVAFWIWRNNRQSEKTQSIKAHRKPTPQGTLAEPQRMLQCTVCGVHLPAAEAISGRQGSYCSVAHRAQLEG
jgi:uncharacterized protein